MILTIRIVKNFEYGVVKYLVLKDLEETVKIGELKERLKKIIKTDSKFLPFRSVEYETIKIFSFPFQNKEDNFVINLTKDDEWILDDEKTLKECNLENECEISFFNFQMYQTFKENPKRVFDLKKN
ncbi:hypothetical protein M0813_09303 [Anaeramoeba flamelloides]|uniref:Uncharacterized protein n=1 Tax=Anaeramoeba flamelloides TaxID=1746091 RepID=A0AAV7YA44_9EUKA|nr:hypothetical protein M0812_29088 [Anaeramoeba flamelloides]KAJ6227889.1 hypothetical protein M0813_09303 [Anaeramoeba flamelloides]